MAEGNQSETVSKADFDALTEKFNSSLATNERILAEHRSDKAKFGKRIGEFEAAAKTKLEGNKNFEELYNQSAAKISSLEGELTTTKYNSFEKNLALEVGKLAKDAHDPKQILRALNVGTSNTDLEAGTLTDLSTQIDGLRKTDINLFKIEQVNQTTAVPRYMKNDNGGTGKTIEQMTPSELEQQIRDNAAARTQ